MDRLRHMLWAAQTAVSLLGDLTEEALRDDIRTLLAVRKCIEIIGEAANRVGDNARFYLKDIPWDDVIGMWHILIHVYYDVDARIVHDTVRDDLPVLIAAIERTFED